jgi:hypothetical protein
MVDFGPKRGQVWTKYGTLPMEAFLLFERMAVKNFKKMK